MYSSAIAVYVCNTKHVALLICVRRRVLWILGVPLGSLGSLWIGRIGLDGFSVRLDWIVRPGPCARMANKQRDMMRMARKMVERYFADTRRVRALFPLDRVSNLGSCSGWVYVNGQ